MLNDKGWKYALLENGDLVKDGDEYYNPRLDQWLPVTDGEPDENGFYPDATIGYEYDREETKPIRRKNN
jgi:hypothetical protein